MGVGLYEFPDGEAIRSFFRRDRNVFAHGCSFPVCSESEWAFDHDKGPTSDEAIGYVQRILQVSQPPPLLELHHHRGYDVSPQELQTTPLAALHFHIQPCS